MKNKAWRPIYHKGTFIQNQYVHFADFRSSAQRKKKKEKKNQILWHFGHGHTYNNIKNQQH
jgi:hypothetical protein